MRADFKRYENYPDELTDIQLWTLTGNMLGDGCIPYNGKGRYHCFSFEQTERREEYSKHIFSILHPFTHTCKIRRICHDKRKFGKGVYHSSQFRTMSHPVFSKLRSQWYDSPDKPRSKKVLPRDLKLNWHIASYWYMDDGSQRIKSDRRELVLCTQSFDLQDHLLLKQRMYEDLDIESHIVSGQNGKYRLAVYGKNYVNFIHHVSELVSKLNCFSYKIDMSGIGLCEKSKARDAAREAKIIEAMTLWQAGFTKQDLAKKFGVTRGTIYTWLK